MANSKYTPEQAAALVASDEPIFIIRGQDRHAVRTIMDYADRIDASGDRAGAMIIDDVRDQFERWQHENQEKVKQPTI